jgi:hypothetical protein
MAGRRRSIVRDGAGRHAGAEMRYTTAAWTTTRRATACTSLMRPAFLATRRYDTPSTFWPCSGGYFFFF